MTFRSEERSSMQATCFSENCLRGLELLRKRRKNVRADHEVVALRQRTKSPQSHERCLSADATTRSGVKVPFERGHAHLDLGQKFYPNCLRSQATWDRHLSGVRGA